MIRHIDARIKGYDKRVSSAVAEDVIRALHSIARCIGKPSVNDNPDDVEVLQKFLVYARTDDYEIDHATVTALKNTPYPKEDQQKRLLCKDRLCDVLLDEGWKERWQNDPSAVFHIKNENIAAIIRAADAHIEKRTRRGQTSHRVKFTSPLDTEDPKTAAYVADVKDKGLS